jgi:ParB family chromosome partitioning protein
MAEEVKSRLGRGLAALMGDVGEEQSSIDRVRTPRRVPIEFLRPNPRNPRKTFSDPELDELAASIAERGVIQPIVVRTSKGGPIDSYEIIAGERRWRAAQRAGHHDVPIVLVEATDRESLELAIIENVQRSDLNAIEEAMGYSALQEEFAYSQDEIAKIVGKSRPHVANTLRLLKLSDTVKAYVHSGKITAGHARMLVGQPNAEALAEQIVDRGLNVRQVEAWTRKDGAKQARDAKSGKRAHKTPDMIALEKRVSDALGLQVTIDHRDGAGTLHVNYSSLEQLEDVLRRLERSGG